MDLILVNNFKELATEMTGLEASCNIALIGKFKI